MESKFRVEKTISAQFFYPWGDIKGEQVAEEITELMWNGNFQDRIGNRLDKFPSVIDWDWEDEGDEYIVVVLKHDSRYFDGSYLDEVIDRIGKELTLLWDSLVAEAMVNVFEENKEFCVMGRDQDQEDNVWDATAPVEPKLNVWNTWDK